MLRYLSSLMILVASVANAGTINFDLSNASYERVGVNINNRGAWYYNTPQFTYQSSVDNNSINFRLENDVKFSQGIIITELTLWPIGEIQKAFLVDVLLVDYNPNESFVFDVTVDNRTRRLSTPGSSTAITSVPELTTGTMLMVVLISLILWRNK